jgi:segregation and condensation protein B
MKRDGVLPFPGPGDSVPPALVAAVEAILFASGAALRLEQLADALPDAHPDDIQAALELLRLRCSAEERGIDLVEVAGGYQLRTDARFADAVARVLDAGSVRLSRAALEVLSVIAWEQPATKGDIDRVRGVDSGATVRSLLQRGLIRVSGRRAEPGRPLEYRTTRAFLQLFSLPDIGSLPTLAEAAELEP